MTYAVLDDVTRCNMTFGRNILPPPSRLKMQMEAVSYTATFLNLYHRALRHSLKDLNLKQAAMKK
jgi:hypothetical protein